MVVSPATGARLAQWCTRARRVGPVMSGQVVLILTLSSPSVRPSEVHAQALTTAQARQQAVIDATSMYWFAWRAMEGLFEQAQRNYQRVKEEEGAEVFRSIEAASLESASTGLSFVAVELAKHGVRTGAERAFLNIVGLALTGKDIAEWLPVTARLSAGYWRNRLQVAGLRRWGQQLEATGNRLAAARQAAYQGTDSIRLSTTHGGGLEGTCEVTWSGTAVVRVVVSTGGRSQVVQAPCVQGRFTAGGVTLLRGIWAAYGVLSDGRNLVAVSGVLYGEQL